MDHAKLKEVEEKQEGYGYQIKHNTLYPDNRASTKSDHSTDAAR